jgi:hypothetical protein
MEGIHLGLDMKDKKKICGELARRYQGAAFKVLPEDIGGLFDCLCGRTCGPQLLPISLLTPNLVPGTKNCIFFQFFYKKTRFFYESVI